MAKSDTAEDTVRLLDISKLQSRCAACGDTWSNSRIFDSLCKKKAKNRIKFQKKQEKCGKQADIGAIIKKI
jgi:hypothetical protein